MSCSLELRRSWIQPQHQHLSVRRQCALLGLAAASYYYRPAPESAQNLFYQRLLDEEFTRVGAEKLRCSATELEPMLKVVPEGVPVLLSPEAAERWKPKEGHWADHLTPAPGQSQKAAVAQKELLQAIDLALSGEWDAAHQIAQQHEDTTAYWIHAVLHKIEGDQDNSRYWYRRAGKLEHVTDEPKGELVAIRKVVAGGE
jgi:hypothetical protein